MRRSEHFQCMHILIAQDRKQEHRESSNTGGYSAADLPADRTWHTSYPYVVDAALRGW
jgi:hypothetical protein